MSRPHPYLVSSRVPPRGTPAHDSLYTGHTRNHTTQSTYTPSSLIAHCVASVSSPHPYGHACSESPTLAPRKAREMSIDNPRITPAGRPASRCSVRDPNQTAGAQRPSKPHEHIAHLTYRSRREPHVAGFVLLTRPVATLRRRRAHAPAPPQPQPTPVVQASP